MKRIKRLLNRQDGAALAFVLCVMAVLLTLCLALLLNISVSLHAAQSRATRSQNRVLATTLSEVLDAQIQAPASSMAQNVTQDILNNKWSNYDEDLRGQSKEATSRHYTFSAEELKKLPACKAVTALSGADVTMYWEKEELNVNDEQAGASTVTRYTLYISVSCGTGGEVCTVTQVYDGSFKILPGSVVKQFVWRNNDMEG